AKISQISEQLGVSLNPDSKISSLDPFTRQGVEIARAFFHEGDFIILDEPTTLLAPAQVEKLFSILIQVRNKGKGVILVTHKLSEVEKYVDDIAVLRGGKLFLNKCKKEIKREELIRAIIGTERETKRQEKSKISKTRSTPEKYLVIEDIVLPPLTQGSGLKGFSLEIYKGEILGITGVPGNGQTEILELLSGLRKASSGNVYIDSLKYSQNSLARLRRSESAFIFPEKDREGLSLDSSFTDNMLLSRKWLKHNSNLGSIEGQKLSNAAKKAINRFNIKSGGSNLPVKSLSGGNRQKIVLAREIEGSVKLLVAAEPVRGLDIHSSNEIAGYFRELKDRGCVTIIISGDMEFLMSLCDRIAVIYKGRINYLEKKNGVNQEKFGKAMLGYN
ncbi:MAG: ATP-binding cassette domain-containing protein, partial [Acidobacteria bacterium]|nr:ATP-binding cassette domain-containing protein [Acidobacteriota bacterium]